MKPPGISIAWLMFGIAMPCIPFAIVLNTMNGQSLTSTDQLSGLGYWPGLVASSTASFAIVKRRVKWPSFLWGFAAMGWASLFAYLACCLLRPGLMVAPIIYYLNHVDCDRITWPIDADRYEIYALNLLVLGLFLATPQLILATAGGWIARWIGGTRWTTT